MLNCKSIFILLLTIGSILAVVLLCLGGQQNHAIPSQNSNNQAHLNQNKIQVRQLSQSYGKPELPAEVSIHLEQTDNGTTPVTMLISAMSKIPIYSGVLTLKVPQIGTEPADTEVLCSGTPSGFFADGVEYVIDTLPEGKYRFIAIFEFTTDDNKTQKQALSKSLYLDVRPTKILSSNISFNHIKRIELWNELEERALTSLTAEMTNTNQKMMSLEMASIKASDPELITRKIEEIKAEDPDIARRIKELNRVKVDTIAESDSVNDNKTMQLDKEVESIRVSSRTPRGEPAVEQALPIPEGLSEN